MTSSIRAAGLVDDAGKSVPSSAKARKKWEEEITEEIRSEISTHERCSVNEKNNKFIHNATVFHCTMRLHSLSRALYLYI